PLRSSIRTLYFFQSPAPTGTDPLSLHDALPICSGAASSASTKNVPIGPPPQAAYVPGLGCRKRISLATLVAPLDSLPSMGHDTRAEDFHGTHAARQGVGGSHSPNSTFRPDPAPDRPASDPRGDDAAGLPDAEGAEAQGAYARADVRHARPHHPDGRPDPSLRRPGGGGDGPAHVPEHEGVRSAALRHGERKAGHRPRHRAGARPLPAGHDDRVR